MQNEMNHLSVKILGGLFSAEAAGDLAVYLVAIMAMAALATILGRRH